MLLALEPVTDADAATELKPSKRRRAPFRARRIARRTMGQKVRVVDARPSRELVFSTDEVRLVLPPKAKYFTRLAECAFCQTEFASRSVPSRSALRLGDNQFLCENCSGPEPHRPLKEGNAEAEPNADPELLGE